jgi:thiol-disulfide isomerase/thioredoxin
MSMPRSRRRRWILVVALFALAALGLQVVAGDSPPAAGPNRTVRNSTRRDGPTALLLAQNETPKPPEAAVDSDYPFPRHVKAPSLDGGIEWINTAGPIDVRLLRGKFVILDFWTYCCINCMHILPVLKQLEHAYPNEIVVIGVHSAKFAGEQDSKNIREAVERYEIEHPVVNDADHKIWDKYEVRSWPSLRVIDPEGNLVAANSGEIEFDSLDRFFKDKLPYYKAKGLLKPGPPPLTGEQAGYRATATPLRYPGKILADEKSDRLFIADSNHNRVVVARLDGELVDVIGSGTTGAADGDFENASFDHPQGMALAGEQLYVADTENHLLRKVDLKKKQVMTIAGTGKQGHGWPGADDFADGIAGRKHRFVGPALKTPLNSPWALVARGHDLFVAMAGAHQIWRLTLAKNGEIGPFAGNGREDIVDGPHLPGRPYEEGFSSFAQPSGLATDGKLLFVADSEGSSIRAVPFDPSKRVETVVGTSWLKNGQPPGRLFLFGDTDGQGQKVRLQHALDLVYHDNLLYVADTYNNKIKAIDPRKGTSITIAGSTSAGKTDEPALFDEPAGIGQAAGKLYIADTNNHAIRTIDLSTNAVATLEIKGLEPPESRRVPTTPGFPGATEVDLATARVNPIDGKLRLQVMLELPEGYKINPLAPLRYLVEAAGGGGPLQRETLGKLLEVGTKSATFDIDLPADSSSGTEKLKIWLAYYYCQSGGEGLCKAGSVVWKLPVTLAPDAPSTSAQLPFKVR